MRDECRTLKRHQEELERINNPGTPAATPKKLTPPLNPSTESGNVADGSQYQSFKSQSTFFISRRSQDRFADSGGTQQMSDQRQFSQKLHISGGQIMSVKGIGNAQFDVLGYGDVKLTALVDGVSFNRNGSVRPQSRS